VTSPTNPAGFVAGRIANDSGPMAFGDATDSRVADGLGAGGLQVSAWLGAEGSAAGERDGDGVTPEQPRSAKASTTLAGVQAR
jgi:hypothetical protein